MSRRKRTSGRARNIPLSIDTTVNPNALSGGFGFFQDQEFTRDNYKADLTTFLAGHSVKGGIDFEHIKAVNQNFNGGAGQRIYKLRTSAGVVYYRHRFYIDDRAPGYVRGEPTTWVFAVPLTSEPDSQNLSWYVQDSWRVGSSLTINGGIRWEGQDVRSRDNESAFKLERQLGAAHRVHMGRDAQQQEQAVRELGPLLREHPDGHQHPRVRRRGVVLLLQLQPRSRQLPPGSRRPPGAVAARRRGAR